MEKDKAEQDLIIFEVVGKFSYWRSRFSENEAPSEHVMRLFRKEEDAKAFASELDAKHKAAEAVMKERDALLPNPYDYLHIQQANREVGLTSEMNRLALFGPWDPEVRSVKVY